MSEQEKATPETPAPGAQEASKPGGKKTPRARFRKDRKVYDLITEAYRLAPGNHTRAAAYASVDRAAARLAWNLGWKGVAWARPVKDVVAEEARDALAAKRRKDEADRTLADADRERARLEAVEELAEEGRLRGTLRKELLGTALVMAELVPAVRALAGVVRSAVLDPQGKPLPVPGVTPVQAIKMLRDYGNIVGRVAEAGERIVQLGRTVRGQANVNVGVMDMSPDEALEELEMAREVLEQAKTLRAAPADDAADAEDAEQEDEQDAGLH